ncbi:E1-E2 ATPase-domain-containing protein [Russula dissimulans]|nr:E1-E2 ATPase-domain-containing protein [Russula dissimulans]
MSDDIEDQRITLVPTESLHRGHAGGTELTARRTLSIQAPTVPTSARLPIEFRTLSLHLENSKRPDGRGKESKGTVKGRLYPSYFPLFPTDLSDLDWHNVSIEEALRRLAVAPKTGLDAAQAQRRAAQFGANQISPAPSRLLRKIAGWVFGGFGSLLLVGSILCFLAWKPLGNPNPQTSNLALALVLVVVVVLQTAFNAWQDFSTSRAIASIQGMLPADVVVLRDGAQTTLPAASLVPGDLVQIALGQKVPADMKLIDVSGDLRLDRSVLTGESEPIAGHLENTNDNILEAKNIALQGTLCVGGSGLGLVFQIGDNTVFGRIAKLSSAAPSSMTTLQREILRVVVIIASLATLVAIFIVILWGFPAGEIIVRFDIHLMSASRPDSAILKFSDDLVSSDTVRARWRQVHKIPFSSRTKFMLTISETMPSTDESLPAPLASWDSFAPGDLLLCVKGAPDVLLTRCTHVVAPGSDRPLNLTHAACERIIGVQEQWATQGRRVLVLARRVIARHLLPKDINPYEEGFDELVDELNSELIVVGLVGLIDPLKPDIPAQAGIISNPASLHHASDLLEHAPMQEKEENGDMLVTQEQSIVITGAELETLTPEQEDVLCSYQEIVFARTTPEQKLRIVRSMQSHGGVIGVAGDGVNDAPAPAPRIAVLRWTAGLTSPARRQRWYIQSLETIPQRKDRGMKRDAEGLEMGHLIRVWSIASAKLRVDAGLIYMVEYAILIGNGYEMLTDTGARKDRSTEIKGVEGGVLVEGMNKSATRMGSVQFPNGRAYSGSRSVLHKAGELNGSFLGLGCWNSESCQWLGIAWSPLPVDGGRWPASERRARDMPGEYGDQPRVVGIEGFLRWKALTAVATFGGNPRIQFHGGN